MKEHKSSQNREIDTKKGSQGEPNFKSIPTLVKRGAPAHQQQTGWVYLILMPGCVNNKSIITRKLEGGNSFITICAARQRRQNGDFYEKQ